MLCHFTLTGEDHRVLIIHIVEPTAIAYKAVTSETLLEPDPHAYLYPFKNTVFLEQSRTCVAIMC